MKTTSTIVILLIMIFTNGFSQDNSEIKISLDESIIGETVKSYESNLPLSEINLLESEHKRAVERGDIKKAVELESQMNTLPADENGLFDLKENPVITAEINLMRQNSQGDWMSVNPIVTSGTIKNSPPTHKQMEVVRGEDNILYAAYNGNGSGLIHGYFFIYKSANNGLDWNYVYGVGSGKYIYSLDMLIESKQNTNPDSTRIIIFYTASFNADYSGAQLHFYSMRVNSSAPISGTIASPSAGNSFTELSAVTDGVFWQSATYFGVVCSETDNATGETYSTRFFRTINWGASWTGASINTTYNDKFPSADYKEGSLDSVYIAVERRFGSSLSEIRVITTPWQPSSSFNTYFLTNGGGAVYEKPCLTIKQDSPADSVLITCTKDNHPVYHFTPDAGGQWMIDYTIAPTNGSNKSFTYCSSSRNGSTPFTAIWISSDGDSISARRGVLGFMGTPVYKVNSNVSNALISPVSAMTESGVKTNSAVVYASSPSGIYCTQEGLKTVNIKIIPQGFYNAQTNSLNMRDTVRIYLHSIVAPYAVVDSAVSVIDSAGGFNAEYQFTSLNDGDYFLSVKHRNFLETWTSVYLTLVITANNDYNFTVSQATAYGNNQIQVDNSPLRFAAYSGDVDQDGSIDLTDIVIIFNDANNFLSGYERSDVTGDSFVDLSDIAITYNNSSNFVSVVRP